MATTGCKSGGHSEDELDSEERSQRVRGRNRTISRMANLQRNYNTSPRRCMVSITHSPPPMRCEIPIGDVSNYYMIKLSAPQALDPGVSPPFQLWPRSSLCDVMDPKITLEEVKRTRRLWKWILHLVQTGFVTRPGSS